MHLGFGGSNSNLEEDEGMKRRTSVMGLNIKDELQEAYGRELDLGGPYECYKNILQGMRMYFLSFDNFPLEFWKALACPLHGKCSLSLLVSQF